MKKTLSKKTPQGNTPTAVGIRAALDVLVANRTLTASEKRRRVEAEVAELAVRPVSMEVIEAMRLLLSLQPRTVLNSPTFTAWVRHNHDAICKLVLAQMATNRE